MRDLSPDSVCPADQCQAAAFSYHGFKLFYAFGASVPEVINTEQT